MKVRIKHTTAIYGYGSIIQDDIYDVEKYNTRFVYVRLNGKSLKLNRDEVELIGKPKRWQKNKKVVKTDKMSKSRL